MALEFKRHRSVTFYAGKLNISPKHFSTIIKEQTGKTAGEWIDEIVMLEAKVLLQNKELTVGQVANELNFNDQSTFWQIFQEPLRQISPRIQERKIVADFFTSIPNLLPFLATLL
ncbi:MAG: AraC family transcriptional regulator [Bacteroidia bacterium]|nr:AraC family transcriptional regulator [Bacteroidia bacterium]